jgi:1-acyl-sn-glycerol-3-phosphate acyltransferase
MLIYFWRLFITAVYFVCFGIGGLFLTLILVPTLHLLPGGEEKLHRRTRYIIHKLFGLLMFAFHHGGIFRFVVTNGHKLSHGRPTLVLANHPSYIDVVALLSRMPNADCVVKSEHWNNPVFGGAVRAAGYIRNDSPESVIEKCSQTVQKGGTLIIFPEGTRTKPDQPMRFMRGAAHIALRSNANILPVTITCNPPTWTKSQRWYEIPREKFRFQMDVGTTTPLIHWVTDTEDSPLAARRLTRALEQHFRGELEVHENYSG